MEEGFSIFGEVDEDKRYEDEGPIVDEKLDEKYIAKDRLSMSRREGKICRDSGKDKVLGLGSGDKIPAA